MHDLTAFQRDMLYIVAHLENDSDDEYGPHGLAVKERMNEYYGEEIHHGRLYPNLDTLVDMGLMKKGKIDERTNWYELADRGRREIAERRQWENAMVGDEADR